MKNDDEKTEQIPVFQEEETPGYPRRPEEPRRRVSWPHIAMLLGIGAVAVILILSLGLVFHGYWNSKDATDTETAVKASATPKATEESDFYTGDDTASPSPSASSKPKASASADADKDKNKDDDDDEAPTDLPLLKSYDNVSLRSGISITAKASTGTFEVVLTDQDGKSTVALNEKGPFDKSDVRTDVSAGTYTISVYGDATGWNWSYTSY